MTDFLAGILAMILSSIPGAAAGPVGYTGYLEADYVYVSPASGGQIVDIAVAEGEAVAAGQMLFAIDDRQQRALLDAATARAKSAQATLDNLVTGGRSPEIEVARAALRRAQSDLRLAQSNLDRSERLFALGNVSRMKLEQDEAARNSAQAQVAQLTAQVDVAELPARNGQQAAAEANLTAAQADARRAAVDLEDRQTKAPIDGVVDRLFFRVGETVAGMPVVSILPAGALKALFFVPEADRAQLALGARVHVDCDGCKAMEATITYMAARPQTTPPVIYSREERGRLVYLVEAKLVEPGTMRPGQPVTVTR
tara:strand:+ start:21074 stop:22009 length:936 start_codon:yes stop_codon:yes gene_type:complete